MKTETLLEVVRNLFVDCGSEGETIAVADIERALRDAMLEGDGRVPGKEEITAACETLVRDNFLRNAGRTGYELTDYELAELEERLEQ